MTEHGSTLAKIPLGVSATDNTSPVSDRPTAANAVPSQDTG